MWCVVALLDYSRFICRDATPPKMGFKRSVRSGLLTLGEVPMAVRTDQGLRASLGELCSKVAPMDLSIVGTWRLVRVEARDGEGLPLAAPYGGAKAMGRLSFNADGRMMAVLCDGRPVLPDGAAREYNSYCGNYFFDGRQLTTIVDAAATGIAMGSKQVRDVSREGDLLVLRPPQRQHAQSIEQRILYWEKIAEQ